MTNDIQEYTPSELSRMESVLVTIQDQMIAEVDYFLTHGQHDKAVQWNKIIDEVGKVLIRVRELNS